mgnify:CR=1 FL=1|tara:strand:+ start:368 stop:853 length:486 start_codon:yes stop_codon:yes gene_type:complete
MKITLKNIKHSEFASHETNCFQADIYIAGKPFACVSNDGVGASDMHYKHPKNPTNNFHADLRKIDEQLKADYPESYGLDGIVSDVLVDYLVTKDVKKLMSRNMIVFEKGEKGYYKYGKKKYNITKERMGWFNNQMWQKFKDNWVCINQMPIAEAVAYFKSN